MPPDIQLDTEDASKKGGGIRVTVKEFIALLIFVFSMSGLYYKIFFAQAWQQQDFEAYKRQTDQRVKNIEDFSKAQFELINKEVRDLQDAETRREAIEAARNPNGFAPMTKIK